MDILFPWAVLLPPCNKDISDSHRCVKEKYFFNEPDVAPLLDVDSQCSLPKLYGLS